MREKRLYPMALGALLLLSASGLAEEIAGITKAKFEAALGSALPGIVKSIAVEMGDEVKKDQPLIEFMRAEEELDVERRKMLMIDKSAFNAATKREEFLSKDLARLKRLFKETQSVSEEDIDKKELEHMLAGAEIKRIELLEKQEEFEYEVAQIKLNMRTLRAPTDGVVNSINIQKGEYGQLGQQLVHLVNVDPCYFECGLSKEQVARVKLGKRYTVRLSNPGGILERQGEVIFISRITDRSSSLKNIRLLVDNKDKQISPGVRGLLILPDA